MGGGGSLNQVAQEAWREEDGFLEMSGKYHHIGWLLIRCGEPQGVGTRVCCPDFGLGQLKSEL